VLIHASIVCDIAGVGEFGENKASKSKQSREKEV